MKGFLNYEMIFIFFNTVSVKKKGPVKDHANSAYIVSSGMVGD